MPARNAKENAETKYNNELASKNSIQAQDFPFIPYAFILIAIGMVEWMINYRSFYEFYPVPFIAGGFTIIVAAAVAFASHCHGTGLKAQDHCFGPHVSPADKSREKRAIISASVALFVFAIPFVGYARYSAATKLISTFSDTGGTIIGNVNLPQINIGQDVMASLASNLLVWFIGAAIAYMVHDKDPNYTKLLRQKKTAEKEYGQHQMKIDKDVARKQAELNIEIQGFKNTAQVMRQNSQPIGSWLDAVNDKTHKTRQDSETLVNRLIQTYRDNLCNLAAVNNPTLKFNYRGNLIDLEAYREITINWKLEE
jgi:hypothetical protein